MDDLSLETRLKAIKRFDVNVEKIEDGCWLWHGVKDRDGYGRFFLTHDGRQKGLQAHRFYFTVYNGKIPGDLTLHHLCGVRNCVRPDHLEPMSRGANARIAAEARKERELEQDERIRKAARQLRRALKTLEGEL